MLHNNLGSKSLYAANLLLGHLAGKISVLRIILKVSAGVRSSVNVITGTVKNRISVINAIVAYYTAIAVCNTSIKRRSHYVLGGKGNSIYLCTELEQRRGKTLRTVFITGSGSINRLNSGGPMEGVAYHISHLVKG